MIGDFCFPIHITLVKYLLLIEHDPWKYSRVIGDYDTRKNNSVA